MSYADDEASLPRAYSDRINAELMKAALRGITLLFESGVDGAGGHGARTAAPNRTSVTGSCGAFAPQFPASSPFATSVGSTALQRVGGELAEVVCDSYLGVGMTSGGGFSRRYAQPVYQRRAVARYLARYPQPPEAFVGEGAGVGKGKRGYPDVAAMAPHFAMFERRRSAGALGATSAATATVGGMIALLNDVRLAGGLPPLGFVNPLLYSLDSTFHSAASAASSGGGKGKKQHGRGGAAPFEDVVYGNNRCSALAGHCCKEGYHAAPGWDACTGLGSINFGALSAKLNTYLGACLGMDCGGGKCERGVCVCNDNFEKNAAGRCIPLPPFPKKKLEEAAGGFVGFMFFCVCCAMCRGGGGDERQQQQQQQRKKPGCCARLRKCLFPYKFVLVRAKKPTAGAAAGEMGVIGGGGHGTAGAGGAAPGTFGGGGGGGGGGGFTAVPTTAPASEQGFSNAYQGGYSGGYDGAGAGAGAGGAAASNISYMSSGGYGESGADMII